MITSNDVSNNLFLGIVAGERCTVSHNDANGNDIRGIAVGTKSLVTSNAANNNSLLGITVSCPSTVTNNTATGNDLATTPSKGTGRGITARDGSGHLVTGDVALNNALGLDYAIDCPSTVTNNESSNGFPASCDLVGPGCRTVNNQ